MSTEYALLRNISSTDLFDGRLEAFGVHEHPTKNAAGESRMLTDGSNYLVVGVSTNGLVSTVTRRGRNAPGKILNAIAEAFDVGIVSEYEPEFWGFDTQEDWDAAREALQKEENERFHEDVLKFLKGEPHDILPDRVGMDVAEFAKRLVEEDPTLLLPTNKSKFIDAYWAIFYGDRAATVTLSPEDQAFAEMAVTHEDDLPKA